MRALLALAMARAGDRAAALALVERLPADARTAAVFAVMARRAVEEGDAAAAVRNLAEARRRDPASKDLPAVAAAVERLRAPLEEQAQRALAEGKTEDAYALADEIVKRFPESKVAARILRHRDEARKQQSADRIARDAEEAMVAGALGQARVLVLKARAEGIRSERAATLEAKIGALEARDRARAAAERVERTVALLGEGNPAPGLMGYLGLDAALRAEVRAKVRDPRLGWLDETGVGEGLGARASAAVQAVLALARAEEDLTRDPRAAIDRVAPHRKALAGVRRVDALVHAAERALTEEARRRALAQLDAAEQAAAGGGEEALRHAARRIEEVRARDLDERGRARLHAVEGRVQRALGRLARRRTVDEHRRKEEHVEAYRALEELVRDADEPAERAELGEAVAAVRADVREAYEVRVEALPPGTRLRMAGPDPVDPPRSILPGGKEVVLAQTAGCRAFLWVVDIASGEVRARVRMCNATPIRIQRMVLEGGILHLVGTTGTELMIEPSTWQPLDASDSEVSPDLTTDTALAPGGRYTWVCNGTQGCFDVDVWDNKREIWCRQTRDTEREICLRSLFGVQPRLAADAATPAMAVIRPMFEEAIALHAAHGTQLASYRKIWLIPDTLVVHPAGDTLLGVEMLRADAVHPIRYRVVELDLKGAPLRMVDPDSRCIPFPDSGRPVQAVVDAHAGLVFLRLERQDGGHEILALKTTPRGAPPPAGGTARPVEEAYRVPAPARTLLVEDPGGGAALAVTRHEQGFAVTTLGHVPPVFSPNPPGERAFQPGAIRLSIWGGCDEPAGARRGAIVQLGNTVFHEPEPVLRARINRARNAGPIALLDLVAALSYSRNVPLMTEAMDEALRAFPEHPEVKLLDARMQIYEKRWDLIPDRLRGVDPDALEPALARHFHHILGLALLVVGQRAEALDVLLRGEGHPGNCDLGLGLALAIPVDDPAAASREWAPDKLAVRTLMRAVAVGDACLAAGDAAGAVRALDTPLVHELGEVQSLARLAEAYLAIAGGAGLNPFVVAQALATFCGAHGETEPFTRCELPLSFPMWDGPRLDALAERAEAWLDAGENRREEAGERPVVATP